MMRKLTLTLAVLFFLSVGPSYAGDPVDIAGSSWFTDGKLKQLAKGVDPASGPASLDLFFGPQTIFVQSDEIVLGPDEFAAVDDFEDDYLIFWGTYAANKKGKPKIRLFGDSRLSRQYERLFDENVVDQVPIDKIKIKAKPKNKNGVESIKVTFKIVMRIITHDRRFAKVTQRYKATGGRL